MQLELYHNDVSTCSQKVRLALAEKGLSWTNHHLDLRAGDALTPDYLRLNPHGVVPTLVADGVTITESTVINEFLDDISGEPRLKPKNPFEKARMRLWTQRLDTGIHAMTGVLTFALYIRHQFAQRSKTEMAEYFRRIPDPERRARQEEIYEHGVDSPLFATAVRRFAALLDEMNEALARGPWLSGGSCSLADIGLAPYLNRLEMLQMSALWEDGRLEHVEGWWERLSGRDTFKEAVVRWIPPKSRDLMAQHGRDNWPAIEVILRSSRGAPSLA